MSPVFKEFIDFLNFKTSNSLSFLEEGIYWLDNSIIKAFDIGGKLVKVARIYINDDLTISTKIYNNQIMLLEKWEDTLKRYNERLVSLESESMKLIKESLSQYSNRKKVVLSSGGKDSSVVTYLVRKCCENKDDIQIIFNNSSLDCADTYRYIKKESNLRIINPELGFYKWVVESNFIPTRITRACCNKFKETSMIKVLPSKEEYLFFLGMRNQESKKRKHYGDKWRNKRWGKRRKWDGILPIRKWSELDVWLYIFKENIPINTKYRKGYKRVGCAIACPYCSKTEWTLDEHFYPILTNRWREILKNDFIKNNKDLIMNCTIDEYLLAWNGGTLRDEPTEEVIEQFAQRNNLDFDVAKKYFCHTCKVCGERIKDKDTLSMNLKVTGRKCTEMYCKEHLMNVLGIDNDDWEQIIKLYKDSDCSLF